MSAQSLTFDGNAHAPAEVSVEMNTGLTALYVLDTTGGVDAALSGAAGEVRWYKFGSYGAAYAEEIGASPSLRLGDDDSGYIAETGSKRYYFWVVNYANHRLDLRGISFSPEQDCDRALLTLDGDAAAIHYFTINGQRKELSRDLSLTYNTLEYDEAAAVYAQRETKVTLPSVDGHFSVTQPLCDTYFTLSGDRFSKQWGDDESVESPLFKATAVEARTSATQTGDIHDNEQGVGTDGLGGSAPCTVTFTAAVTDAAVFTEWQLSRDAEFEDIDDRYRQLEFDYTFREQGTSYVRFVANNDAGTCEFMGETYEIFIGESALVCPNAFSPGASEGVNDEWKVSYKSIVEYECHIFNRWGTRLFSATDPSVGWDGKYKGKLVPSGAYYYVIKAVGSDGRKYDLSGDINILRSKTTGSPSADPPAE